MIGRRAITYTKILIFVVAALILAMPVVASAQTQPTQVQPSQQTAPVEVTPPTVQSIADNVCKGVIGAETGTFTNDTTLDSCQETPDSSFGFLARRVINIFSIIVGAVSVIMIIVGGFRYIISGGDSSSVQGAKNTILYAVVGLVIVIFAQVIIRFVLTNVAPSAG